MPKTKTFSATVRVTYVVDVEFTHEGTLRAVRGLVEEADTMRASEDAADLESDIMDLAREAVRRELDNDNGADVEEIAYVREVKRGRR